MAKQVVYQGESPVQLGRFGVVKPGALLTLNEQEYRAIAKDPLYHHVEEAPPGPAVEIRDTAEFQFTLMPWGTTRVYREINRKSKSTLLRMCTGMQSLGVDAPASHDMTQAELVDIVLTSARKAGWTKDD